MAGGWPGNHQNARFPKLYQKQANCETSYLWVDATVESNLQLSCKLHAYPSSICGRSVCSRGCAVTRRSSAKTRTDKPIHSSRHRYGRWRKTAGAVTGRLPWAGCGSIAAKHSKGRQVGTAVVPKNSREPADAGRHSSARTFEDAAHGKLSDEEIAILKIGSTQGAYWPAEDKTTAAKPAKAEYVITPEQRAFWAFQPVKSRPPRVRRPGWAKSRDRPFVLAGWKRRAEAVDRGRQADADPPRDVRPDRPAADARGGRRIS